MAEALSDRPERETRQATAEFMAAENVQTATSRGEQSQDVDCMKGGNC